MVLKLNLNIYDVNGKCEKDQNSIGTFKQNSYTII